MKNINLYAYVLTVGVFFGLHYNASAQFDYNKINIASPNAASLGKFGDIPVNYHTGIPQINVPLYTIKDGTLEMPISLSYHAGGVKVAEQASWVGAGWALNAGGVITRSVRGIPDEARNTNRGEKGHLEDYGFNSFYLQTETSDPLKNFNYSDRQVADGIYDAEPDLFSFNFDGYSGKFYFNDDRKPVLVSGNENLKIDYFYRLPVSSPAFEDKSIQGFCITTGNGTKYFFGKTDVNPLVEGINPVEMSIPFDLSNGVSSDRVVSSWYLKKVESADKLSSINLIYEAENYSSYSWSYFPITSEPRAGDNGYAIYKLYILGVRLSKIVFSQGTVLFAVANEPRLDLVSGSLTDGDPGKESPNVDAKALKQISISSNSHTLKKISFYSSYFKDDNTPLIGVSLNLSSDTKRLKLDSISESGADGTALKPYKFDYYSSFLPRRLSFGFDHWGFYNGASNSTVLPTLTRDTYDVIYPNGANRESSWPAMQQGALNKITYPTGGIATFEFEANRAKVNAVRYNLQYFQQYSVGFSGNPNNEFTNIAFSGNEKYQIIFSNTQCQNGVNCTASYNIYQTVGGKVVASGGAAAGKTNTSIISIPAGNYNVKMYRDGAYSGTGATITISKYVAAAVLDPIVGGLRIKKITKDGLDNSSAAVSESYSYEDAGRSSGILYERPYYITALRNNLVAKLGLGGSQDFPEGCVFFPGSSIPGVPVVISPMSSVPMSNVQGNHMGYATVRVDQGSKGYSVYRYYSPSLFENNIDDVAHRNVISNVCDPNSPNFPTVPVHFEFERGELKSEYHFDSSDQLLKSTNYRFSFDSTKVYTPALIVKDVRGLAYTSSEYQLRGYWKKYIIKNETTIDKNTFKAIYNSDTTFFNSPYHRSQTRKSVDQSIGGVLSVNYKYALDFRVPDADAISDGWDTYQSSCSSCLTEYINKISAPGGGTSNNKKLYYVAYRVCFAKARKSYVDYQILNFTGPDNNFAKTHLIAKNSAGSELKTILEMQDQFINPVVEVANFNNGKLTGASFNTFSLEAGTSNPFLASVSTIPLLFPISSTYSVSGNTNGVITKDNRYVTNFLYQNSLGNIVEQSKDKGPKEVFLWGYKNKYPVARILSGNYAAASALITQSVLDKATTTQEQMRTELNKLRLGLPDAQVSTYTYDPLVGITSQTDAKGQTIYYEYDEFQRLKTVKDQLGNIIKNNSYHYKN
ncbi:YD repeat-containing protein [Pedobacter cryoconitis]|uniref:YD repeat-containing protein n=1 Tax=Pedobacter cryoconitis TaxID=188932 RepID=A0A7W8YQS5_9SPHI|nr:hypothetical protein [Pedobacter cryoconitis]MBB5620112.1 YD repeat-containing protein [Pedobacter cryoconitis]